MDIKTELKNDTLLFIPAENQVSAASMIRYLNSRGITTIEDLINCDANFFRGNTKIQYRPIIEVYRHEFLGEPLVIDILLEKEYEYSDDGHRECENDIRRLGLRGNIDKYFPRYISRLERKFGPRFEQDESIDIDKKISMEKLLHDGAIKRYAIDLAGYYLRYIEQKRKEQQSNKEIDDSTTLSDLKKQFQSLLEMRDNLDEQIKSIQESIERIERGESGNVRK